MSRAGPGDVVVSVDRPEVVAHPPPVAPNRGKPRSTGQGPGRNTAPRRNLVGAGSRAPGRPRPTRHAPTATSTRASKSPVQPGCGGARQGARPPAPNATAGRGTNRGSKSAPHPAPAVSRHRIQPPARPPLPPRPAHEVAPTLAWFPRFSPELARPSEPCPIRYDIILMSNCRDRTAPDRAA